MVLGLVGRTLPSLKLESAAGPVDLADLGRNLLVLFVYPHATGLGGAPVPGWDAIPGARGCTAESCGFRDRQAAFEAVGATICGLSVQRVEEQRAFAARVGIGYRLISDPDRRLASMLGLPTFTAHGRTFYRRLTLVTDAGRIKKVFYPIHLPGEHASEVLAWLEQRPRA
ncbi:MAG TPA: peroxiredoxin [Candidatus Limnocylindria bacterium]|nr:peroxiredoxin [Candidatus Limnocylindria bacterium]